MDKELELVEHKASILIDALPYIRDFNQKTVVIEYGCAEWLSGVEEQRPVSYTHLDVYKRQVQGS